MQTHENEDHPLRALSELAKKEESPDMERLEQRALAAMEAGTSTITAGKPGEEPLLERKVGHVHVIKMPDDPDCTRVSLGGVGGRMDANYLVYRGNGAHVRELFAKAIYAMRNLP